MKKLKKISDIEISDEDEESSSEGSSGEYDESENHKKKKQKLKKTHRVDQKKPTREQHLILSGESIQNHQKQGERIPVKKITKNHIEQTQIEELEKALNENQRKLEEANQEKVKLEQQNQGLANLQQDKQYLSTHISQFKDQAQTMKSKLELAKRQSFALDFKVHNLRKIKGSSSWKMQDQLQNDGNGSPNKHGGNNFFKSGHGNQGSSTEKQQPTLSVWNSIILYLNYSYFMSGWVYKIQNNYGQIVQIHFSFIAQLINNYIVGILLFSAAYIVHFIYNSSKLSEQGHTFFLLTSFTEESKSYISISSVIFIAVQIALAATRFTEFKTRAVNEKAKSLNNLAYFKKVFSSWNWKANDKICIQKYTYSLAKTIQNQFIYDEEVEIRQMQIEEGIGINLALTLRRTITNFIVILIILGSIYCSLTIEKSNIFSITHSFIDLLLLGLVEGLISIVSSVLIEKVCYFEKWVDRQQEEYWIGLRMLISEILHLQATSLLKIGRIQSNNDMFFGLMPSGHNINHSYECLQEQLAYEFISLLLGVVLAKMISSLLFALIFKLQNGGSQIEGENTSQFQVIDRSIPIMIVNILVFNTVPVVPFIFFHGIAILMIFFIFNWMMLHFFHRSDETVFTFVQANEVLNSFNNIQLIFNFIFYVLLSSYRFDNDQSQNSDPCGPFGQNESQFSYIRQLAFDNYYGGLAFDIITWDGFVWMFMVFFGISSIVSKSIISRWYREYQIQYSELQGIQQYYQERIKRLEIRLDQANHVLDENIQHDPQSVAEYTSAGTTVTHNTPLITKHVEFY